MLTFLKIRVHRHVFRGWGNTDSGERKVHASVSSWTDYLLENGSVSEFHSSEKTQSSTESELGQMLSDEKHFNTFIEKNYEIYSQRFTVHIFQGSTSRSEKGIKMQ